KPRACHGKYSVRTGPTRSLRPKGPGVCHATRTVRPLRLAAGHAGSGFSVIDRTTDQNTSIGSDRFPPAKIEVFLPAYFCFLAIPSSDLDVYHCIPARKGLLEKALPCRVAP